MERKRQQGSRTLKVERGYSVSRTARQLKASAYESVMPIVRGAGPARSSQMSPLNQQRALAKQAQ